MSSRVDHPGAEDLLAAIQTLPTCQSAGNGRFSEILRHSIADLIGSDDLRDWRLSSLTATGFPAEFTFTSANDGFRCTVEVARHSVPASARLQLAAEAMTVAGGDVPDPAIIEQFDQMQAGAQLNFGAWLGLRISDHGVVSSKLYVEVPEARPAQFQGWAHSAVGSAPALPGRTKSLRMIGYIPSQGRLETYYSIRDLRPWELAALMQPIGLSHRAHDVRSAFEATLRRPLHQAFPSPIMGFSYASSQWEQPSFSLYGFCEHLFASESATRHRILAHLDRRGQKMAGYDAASRPFANDTGRAKFHGLFGFACDEKSDLIAHIGLTPTKRARR